ncbi:MAG: hypothetical protein IK029_05840 [Oscillospiraceae bacterium]|nr:hypothetical protein [Oscillospiraceae bacterium]MBR5980300.1 hypothetical protein [Oscillospiraceae bacterium]
MIKGDKKYVGAHVIHYPGGGCCPTVIEVDGKPYVIQRIFRTGKLRASENLGAEEYFLIEVSGREKVLLREGQRWFVVPGLEVKKEAASVAG